jgi:hypothetical protein
MPPWLIMMMIMIERENEAVIKKGGHPKYEKTNIGGQALEGIKQSIRKLCEILGV